LRKVRVEWKISSSGVQFLDPKQTEISMAENKTQPTKSSAIAFLNKIKDKQVRDDCFTILEMMRDVSKCEPVMWGSSIVGFGTYHYVYESGREGDWMPIGFSPRKQNVTMYLMPGLGKVEAELAKLGKHKTGGGCLYVKTLSDVNITVLRKILAKSFKEAQRKKTKAA
jgi:hypothetical protein